MQTPEVYICRL